MHCVRDDWRLHSGGLTARDGSNRSLAELPDVAREGPTAKASGAMGCGLERGPVVYGHHAEGTRENQQQLRNGY